MSAESKPSPSSPPATEPQVAALAAASTPGALYLLEQAGFFAAFEFDLVAQTLFLSDEALRRFGFSAVTPDVTFSSIWQRILPGDRERVERAAIEGAASGRFSTVFRIQVPNRPLAWMQVQALLYSADLVPLKWSGILLEASPALVAETVQQEARDQVFQLVESIAESFIALDHEFRFTWVNKRVLDRTGKTRQELIGQVMWDVFPEAAATSFYSGYRRVATERVRHSFLVSYKHPDGSEYWYEAHAFPTAEGIAATIRDVTELKRANEALEASEERFRRAQQAANIGAFEWNLQNDRLTWAAKVPTFTEVADADTFQSYLRFVHEADRPSLLSVVDRILHGGQHSTEVRILPPDGRTLWFYFRAEAVFDPDGHPTRMYGIAMDVTERKLAEEALRNSEKLAAAGRLAATIAHEINNPLAAVTNLLYLARSSADPASPTHEYLRRTESELQRVAAIVRQTLGFYRGGAAAARIDLNHLIRDAVALFEKPFAAREVQLVQHTSGPVFTFAIEGEIRQIIANLLGNALDAVSDGGSVSISLAGQHNTVCLEVRDNGRGISAEVMEHLFQPFFTTKRAAGTGLGLWVSRELARKNGGGIEAASAGEGLGSSFVLTLPLA